MAEGYYLGVLVHRIDTISTVPTGAFLVLSASNYANMRIYAYILIAQKRTL